jgi:RHS repeat-associated protein
MAIILHNSDSAAGILQQYCHNTVTASVAQTVTTSAGTKYCLWDTSGNGETIAYDANGNITSLTRTGARAETLAYTYTSGTNRLGKVTVGGSQKSYAYNADGTMKTDGLRGLALTYNYLKLPRTVKRGTTSTVTYIYDAAGNKLAVSQDGTAKNYYCGDFVYDGSLAVAYILTPNGQLTRNPSTGAYTSQYNIPDHLGNVRSVVSSSGTVLQSTDYYPFGLAFSDSNIASNRYLYNGKELEDYTLGTSYLGTLDYGARHYDPRIARWTIPDPLAEKYYGVNGYSYCADNPVYYNDPTGLLTDNFIFSDDGKFEKTVIVPNEPHKIIVRRKEGKPIIATLADQINDPSSINRYTRVFIVSNHKISNLLEAAGANDDDNHGIIAGVKYLLAESNAGRLEGGKLDFVGSGDYNINPDDYYITNTPNEGNVAHNGYNFGNFLWGASASALGVPQFVAKAGAHANNFFFDYIHKWTLDSKDDQYSISVGYHWQMRNK